MYRQLFAWINWRINAVFDFPEVADAFPGEAAGAEADKTTFIGILDIFGETRRSIGLVKEAPVVLCIWERKLRPRTCLMLLQLCPNFARCLMLRPCTTEKS